MAPTTTFPATNTTEPLRNMVKTDNNKSFCCDFGSFQGVEILYIIIAGIALICLLCCTIIICYKVTHKSSRSNSDNNKNTQFRKNESINTNDNMNGVELNWKYTVKGQKVDQTSYRSSLAKNSSHHTLPTNTTLNYDNDNDKAFERIINDRKTTITHNPLQRQSMHSNESNIISNITSPNSANSANSYPTNNSNSSPYNIPTISPNSYHPNSFPNISASPIGHSNDNQDEQIQILSGSGSDTEHSDLSESQATVKVKEYAVVDTLTSIVNAARSKENGHGNGNQKKMTHVLSLNKLHIDGNKNHSMHSIEFDMEPSPSPQPQR